jgi:hypothetical protein
MGPPESLTSHPENQEPGRRKQLARRPRMRRCLLKGCQHRFHPRQARQRYCSEECREAAREWSRWKAPERESVATLALCQYQTEFTMAEWQYRVERIQLKPETDLDSELEEILEEYGQQGWELVQVWRGQETLDNSVCRIIFKIEKPVLAH